MSHKQPLMQDTGDALNPSAPVLSFDEGQQGGRRTPEPGEQLNDAPPPAYTIPAPNDPVNQPYAPMTGATPMIAQQPIQHTSQPQVHQPQGQQIIYAQYNTPANNNINSNNNQYPGVAARAAPSAAAAAAPAAPAAPQATVIIVPAQAAAAASSNGYVQMPGNGQVGGAAAAAPRPAPIRAARPYPAQVYPAGADDPCCLYTCAILALFFPLIGLICMCCFNCGNGLTPRKRSAYRRLVAFTIVGMIINVIWWYYNDNLWYDDNDDDNNNWN